MNLMKSRVRILALVYVAILLIIVPYFYNTGGFGYSFDYILSLANDLGYILLTVASVWLISDYYFKRLLSLNELQSEKLSMGIQDFGVIDTKNRDALLDKLRGEQHIDIFLNQQDINRITFDLISGIMEKNYRHQGELRLIVGTPPAVQPETHEATIIGRRKLTLQRRFQSLITGFSTDVPGIEMRETVGGQFPTFIIGERNVIVLQSLAPSSEGMVTIELAPNSEAIGEYKDLFSQMWRIAAQLDNG